MWFHVQKIPLCERGNNPETYRKQPLDKEEGQSVSPDSHPSHSSDSEQALQERLQRFAQEAGIVISDSQGRRYFPWSDLSPHCQECRLRNWYLKQTERTVTCLK